MNGPTYVRINNCTVPHPSISKGSGGVIYRQAFGVSNEFVYLHLINVVNPGTYVQYTGA